MSLIETPKSGNEKLIGKTLWMLDSGASIHMTGDVDLLSKTKNIWPILIDLPNDA